jgi:hypothetical protein
MFCKTNYQVKVEVNYEHVACSFKGRGTFFMI